VEKMTIKAYARKHKMSIFQVVKMVKSGSLKSEVTQEEGKEVTYVLLEKNSPQKEQKIASLPQTDRGEMMALKKEIATLNKRLSVLENELYTLRKMVK